MTLDKDEQWWQTDTNDEVATSPRLWRPIENAIDGFDLDPAAGCEPSAIADERYTVEDDGLSQPWFGCVWLNPPFSNKTPWYRRLATKFQDGDIERAVALATVDPSANWFHEWFSTADRICYHKNRDLYLNGGGSSPTFSTMIGAWNPTPQLCTTLAGMGSVVAPVEEQGDGRQHARRLRR